MSSEPPGHSITPTSLHFMAVGLFGAASLAFILFKHKRSIFPIKFLNRNNIQVIETRDECIDAVKKIKIKVSKYRVLGFDCEWVTRNGNRHPVGLLQLASNDGYCALIRLCKIQHIPKELKSLLEDESILKVGVAPIDDAKYLTIDYGVRVNGMVDLRYLSLMISEKPEGLSFMAKKYLNITLDKNWHIRCSNWDIDILSNQQINYAAADAYVAIGIFKKIIDKILLTSYFQRWFHKFDKNYWNQVHNVCSQYINTKFKLKHTASLKGSSNQIHLLSTEQRLNQFNFKQQNRNYTRMIKKKIPYQNCIMQTSEGEILCTCEKKKAEWYIEKGLADCIKNDPITIRLKFEPAGKSVGDVGRFYQMPRENCCVVCGLAHSYIRKNVIPKEYRKLFPAVMKDHSSHDVLLLCLSCHQLSNIKDQILRNHLATLCNAPMTNLKLIENFEIKKIKSAARALLLQSSKHHIPKDRKEELENMLKRFFPDVNDINDEFLYYASNLVTSFENTSYQSHGEKVVEYFKNSPGGLLQLETMWREHFITTMSPQFMPELWSTTHTKSRLEIRAVEGRVTNEDLIMAGLNIVNMKVN